MTEMIVERRVRLSFPKELLDRPLIHGLIRRYDLLTNILEAHVTSEEGTMILAVRGEASRVEEGLAWMAAQGVRVESLSPSEEGPCAS